MSVVDYRGLRMVAMTTQPITSESLVFGSPDAFISFKCNEVREEEGSQEELGGVRRSQEEPGGARRSQEEP